MSKKRENNSRKILSMSVEVQKKILKRLEAQGKDIHTLLQWQGELNGDLKGLRGEFKGLRGEFEGLREENARFRREMIAALNRYAISNDRRIKKIEDRLIILEERREK